MNAAEFRKRGYEMIDFVADYMDNIHNQEPMPRCKPGYMRSLIPKQPPEKSETWESIMSDIEPVIMKGMTHWQHPHFHAYFPSGNSWPSILGDILSNAFAGSVATWGSCPAGTELEIIMMDWIAKFLRLPKFLYSKFSNPESQGGGCIQTSASECVFVAIVAAREEAIGRIHRNTPSKKKTDCLSMLMAYGSGESHSCFDKACIMANVKYRLLPLGDRGNVTGATLQKAIAEDQAKGLVPFFYNAILGSTSACAFDDLFTIGPICKTNKMWLHADAAYAGASFCCQEMAFLMEGLEHITSFNTNANKWLLTTFDCSLFWVKNLKTLTDCMSGNDETLRNSQIVDFRHWGIPATRRIRALKLWFVIRTYGVDGIRSYIRNHIRMAKTFNHCVKRDMRFETIGCTRMGLSCFRLKGESAVVDSLNARLLYIIRFAVCSEFVTESDIEYAWSMIAEYAEVLLRIHELEKKDNEELEDIIQTAHEWKKLCPRPMNTTVVHQIKDYRERKVQGKKDFLAESLSQTTGSLSSTLNIKYIPDAAFISPSTKLDAAVFKIIEKESANPTRVLMDSRGRRLKVASACPCLDCEKPNTSK